MTIRTKFYIQQNHGPQLDYRYPPNDFLVKRRGYESGIRIPLHQRIDLTLRFIEGIGCWTDLCIYFGFRTNSKTIK